MPMAEGSRLLVRRSIERKRLIKKNLLQTLGLVIFNLSMSAVVTHV